MAVQRRKYVRALVLSPPQGRRTPAAVGPEASGAAGLLPYSRHTEEEADKEQEEGRRRRSVMDQRHRKDGSKDFPGAAAVDDMDADSPNGGGGRPGLEGEEIDPLDAFMNSMVVPEVVAAAAVTEKSPPAPTVINRDANATARIVRLDEEDEGDDDDWELMKHVKKRRKATEKLSIAADHCEVDLPPFRKSFYIESPEIAKTTGEEVAAYRKRRGIKLHGGDVPKPAMAWVQCGLTSKLLGTVRNKLGLEKPTPIQAQAVPVIMSGRDCIAIARTGSGKTLAFVLPMLRHVKDQPPSEPGDGPVALVIAPTRELVAQVHSDTSKLSKPPGIRCAAVYGGSDVARQIGALKWGAEIVVCTPGRMIDILCCAGSGNAMNKNLLRRVTFLVMDEADRMFDLGFEPQIRRIIQNTRPDRQTVLFSATFPWKVEKLARRVLTRPVEIEVGRRSVANADVAQLVEVRPRRGRERFLRLLELLGEWFHKGKVLVFVRSRDRCDSLFQDLLRHWYPCLTLHGGREQDDRESAVADFKGGVCNLLVAARGLDVRELELVVNYDAPSHYEEYVHRVGRTGRAGRKGLAVTFISEEEERCAPDLVRALEGSRQPVPEDLKGLADGFTAKVNRGTEEAHGSGYGGSGFKFDDEEEAARRVERKARAMAHYDEEAAARGYYSTATHTTRAAAGPLHPPMPPPSRARLGMPAGTLDTNRRLRSR
ncbi:hypothetical protein C2845_PM05G03680 [Panicum miliaceum]|uniref:RNA helicase n=1 Tax=Panicum miliaceum TaxID=4540 RepID=A0A3L6T582_PANMI|nr:hypothetical protein C2845_PM05G03680 [Panicum miliaceum]